MISHMTLLCDYIRGQVAQGQKRIRMGGTGYMIFKAFFFWTDSISSLRYFGSAAHAGEPYSSTDLTD